MSTFRLPSINARGCSRPERSTELTVESWAEGLKVNPALLQNQSPEVKWTRGVGRILGVGHEPTPISEVAIQIIKDRMGDDDTVELLEDLQEGDLIQITSAL